MSFLILVMLASPGFAQEGLITGKDGGTTLAFYAKYVLRGDYIIGSEGLRFKGTGSINISGIPFSSEIAAAYLIYSVIANSPQPQGYINGTPLSGNLVGYAPSPCWPEAQIYTYIANVTDVVRAQGNGTYSLTGFYNPSGEPAPGGAEGATLIVIYCDYQDPMRTLVIYLGAYTLKNWPGGTYSWDIGNFRATTPVSRARTTLLFADGQDFWSEEYNGFTYGKEDVYFNGNLVRSGTYGLPGADGNLWDAVHIASAADYIPPGATLATGRLTTIKDGEYVDCITTVGHILSVSSTEAETYNCVLSAEEGIAEGDLSLRVAGNRIILNLPFPAAGSLSLYSSDGRLVRVLAEGVLSSGEIPVPSLGPGVYFLRLGTEMGKAEAKLIGGN